MSNSIIERLEDLKKRISSVSVWDNPAKDDVVRRAILYAKRAFGPDTHFVDSIKDTKFEGIAVVTSSSPPGPSSYDRRMWEDGKRNLTTIVDLMIEEFKWKERSKSDEDVVARVREIVKSSKSPEPRPSQSKRVFVVHGHDEEMKQYVARTITQLKLEPLILHERPDRGRTIIEKFEEEASDVGFAAVLLSPDDEGCRRGDKPKPRARQNVVFELGFFYGKLGRSRVVAIYREEEGFDLPSDIFGVIYVPYDRGGAWRMRLCQELKASGYDVSADNLIGS